MSLSLDLFSFFGKQLSKQYTLHVCLVQVFLCDWRWTLRGFHAFIRPAVAAAAVRSFAQATPCRGLFVQNERRTVQQRQGGSK